MLLGFREGREKGFKVCFTATASLRAPLQGQGSAETASPNLPGTSALVKSLPGAFVGRALCSLSLPLHPSSRWLSQ